ncbi:MAG: DUF697 domain-containing protein, partial [Anaeroplasmataceae bacterium]
MKKRTKYLWYTLGIGAFFIFFMLLLSSVINVGEKLRTVHISLEISFYVVTALIVFFVIINPIRIILFSPSLTISTSLEVKKTKYSVYKRIAKNLIKNNELPLEDVVLLSKYKNRDQLKENIQIVFERTIKSQLNKVILKNAKIVLVSTAICQNARLDMITTFSVNLRMIKELVQKCGFRPSLKNLSKLSLNVLGTALIAEGLENLRLEDILPQSATNTLGEIPLIKPVMNSVTQGVANSLLTL